MLYPILILFKLITEVKSLIQIIFFLLATGYSRDQNCLPSQQAEKTWAQGANNPRSLQSTAALLILYCNSFLGHTVMPKPTVSHDQDKFQCSAPKRNINKGPSPSEHYTQFLGNTPASHGSPGFHNACA